MIQLQKSGVVVDPDDIGRLKSAFERDDCVLLPKLLEPELLKFILPRLEQQPWITRIEKGIATEDVLDDELALSLLHFVANTPGFLGAVRDISGCPDVILFRGRLYRFIPNSIHHDSWHDDVGGNTDRRLIGMSINLGSREYAGGVFQLREHHSKRIIFEIANTGWGDATLFRISSCLDHQVTAVMGNEPRISFAGWFRADAEDFFTSLRRAAAQVA